MRNKRFFIVLAGALVLDCSQQFPSVVICRVRRPTPRISTGVALPRSRFPLGTKIIAEQVMVVQFPQESTPDGAFESVDKLAGRVAVVNIAPREPITEARLAPEGTAGGLSAVIPEGYRAMTVKVDDVVGISGFIMPGTLVDVVVVIDPRRNGAACRIRFPRSSCRTSRYWQTVRTSTSPKANVRPTASRQSRLLVTPEQAEKLALAASEGKLQLVMRNSIDQGDEQTTGNQQARTA